MSRCNYSATIVVPSHELKFKDIEYVMQKSREPYEVKNHFEELFESETDEAKKYDYEMIYLVTKEASQNNGKVVRMVNSSYNECEETGMAEKKPAVEITCRFETFEDLISFHESLERAMPFPIK